GAGGARVAPRGGGVGTAGDQARGQAAAIRGGETRNKGRSADERRDGAGLRAHADGRAISESEDEEGLAGRWAQREPERHGGERRLKAGVAKACDRVLERHPGKRAEAVVLQERRANSHDRLEPGLPVLDDRGRDPAAAGPLIVEDEAPAIDLGRRGR